MSQQNKKPQQNKKWRSAASGDRDEDHIHLPPPDRRRVKPPEAPGKP